MIGKVTRGSDIGGLLRYLYGPGRANEHKDPHLVASWLGDDRVALDPLEPALVRGRPQVSHLADRLKLPLDLLADVPAKYVWQCSMRLAETDRRLTDPEWAQVAREVVQQTGFAPDGDAGGCRWVAVRHADDHIHIGVVLARQDGQPVQAFRDWPKVHAAARVVEQRFGLMTVPSPNRSSSVSPGRGERNGARRRGRREPTRTWLAREVRVAAAGSASREEFEAMLGQVDGMVVHWRPAGRHTAEVSGYAVGRAGEVDSGGVQILYSGSKLAPDLSLPKLRARWLEVAAKAPVGEHSRIAVLVRAHAALAVAGDRKTPQDVAIAAAELATTLARAVEGTEGGPLTQAADKLAEAVRLPEGRRPESSAASRRLAMSATEIARLGSLGPREVELSLVIVGNLARIVKAMIRDRQRRENDLHRHRLHQIRLALGYSTRVSPHQPAQVLAALGRDLAERVLTDPAWPALAAQMRRTEAVGSDPVVVLRQVAPRRELGTAGSICMVLHHRMRVDLDRKASVRRTAVVGQRRRGL